MLRRLKSAPGLWVLGILTSINLFNYMDRYILVALSPAIKRDFQLSDTWVGILISSFILSYLLISPVFGYLGDRKPRYRLMSFGVALWSLATAAAGFAQGFLGLLWARLFVGVGEASYGAISPSVLRDLFPKEKSGKVFAIFFMAIPVGSAIGFLVGGILEKTVGWHRAFFVAGAPGLLLAALLLFLTEPKVGTLDKAPAEEKPSSALADYKSLAGNPSYRLTTLGYCAYTFVLGGISAWIPHYIERYLGVPAADGNIAFGAITVVAGLLGTLVGGVWADRWAKVGTDAYLKLSALSMFAAFPIYVLVMAVRSFPAFCVLVFVLEFLLFLSTSPINAEIVNCVSPKMRATASAMAIFMIHLFGDLLSPTLIGFISTHSNLALAMQLFALVILVSGGIWAWKVLAQWEAMPWPEGAFAIPTSQCHRGFHETAQENTLEAFRAAAIAGAPMIELDVRLSRDEQVVVIHDPDIQRISGKPGEVRRLTASELQTQAKVPTLRDVLQDKDCRQLLVNVELKHEGRRTSALVEAVAKVVRDTGSERRVLFSSFDPLALRRASQLLPRIPRALIATGAQEPGNRFYLKRMFLAFLARPHILHFDGRFLTEGLGASLKARRVPLAVWTVTDAAEAKKFLAMGARSIISPIPRIV
jgi:glycerophosphoryl diester phosphodiesterase/predicted MFS family arabinose efflux permease